MCFADICSFFRLSKSDTRRFYYLDWVESGVESTGRIGVSDGIKDGRKSPFSNGFVVSIEVIRGLRTYDARIGVS